ncbi:hypothetical protein EMCRGX_G026068 [Ephydatia muelleri]
MRIYSSGRVISFINRRVGAGCCSQQALEDSSSQSMLKRYTSIPSPFQFFDVEGHVSEKCQEHHDQGAKVRLLLSQPCSLVHHHYQ